MDRRGVYQGGSTPSGLYSLPPYCSGSTDYISLINLNVITGDVMNNLSPSITLLLFCFFPLSFNLISGPMDAVHPVLFLKLQVISR